MDTTDRTTAGCLRLTAVLLGLALAVPEVAAEDGRIELRTTRVKASHELPGVLYIVPWRSPVPPAHPRPVVLHSLRQPALRPVDDTTLARRRAWYAGMD